MEDVRYAIGAELLADCPPGLRATDKFIILRWLQKYGRNDSIGRAVDDIAQDLKITESKLRRSLQRLLSAGLVGKKTTPSKRGPTKALYEFTGKGTRYSNAVLMDAKGLKAACWMLSPSADDHLSRVEVEVGEGARRGEEKAHCLTEANRLLLAILLFHADEFGWVDGVSFAKLAKLTGMKPDQVKAHIRKAASLGYIRSIIPGVSSKNLIGKVATSYVLNTSLASPRKASCQIITVILEEPWITNISGKESGLVRKICRGIKHGGSTKNLNTIGGQISDFNMAKFEEITWIFDDLKRKEVAFTFQHKIELLTSILLSQYWDTINKDGEDAAECLKDYVDRSFSYARSKILEREGLLNPEASADYFCDFISGLIVVVARRIQRRLEEVGAGEGLSYSEMTHFVSPSGIFPHKDNGFSTTRCIISINDNASAAMRGLHIWGLFKKENKNSYISFTSEDDKGVPYAYQFGIKYHSGRIW
ncbi:hypothetical protein SAMN05192555_105109 [Franzmannia pantelleriensis]|uniref:Uncharacterized protein n=1 Tax=Franzmannia pantelleriensis TaxID=48727 RepID=A0A1G9L146_9GAMM|nr:helix-turn-helix domain-containing protein [Halomonas pantelleriensis]SDL55427.1 hypothetical protein SAMN05192555_105109 [Halomonas pantelleriensis]